MHFLISPILILATLTLFTFGQTTNYDEGTTSNPPECQVNPDGHGKCIDLCKELNKGIGCCYPVNPDDADNNPEGAPPVEGRCVCCQITDVCIPWFGKYNGRSCPSKACEYANGEKCPDSN